MAITKKKGDIAEAKVLSYFVGIGYKVFIPWGEDHRYDLICDINGILKRIQVKYVTPKNNCIEIPLRSCNNWSRLKYNSKMLDVIAAYDPLNDKIYFVSLVDFPNTATIKLRLDKAKNCQKKHIKLAANFEELKA